MEKQPFALVTGASKGIGYEIARQLAGRGFHVLLTARNAKAGEKAAAEISNCSFIEMDVANVDSIRGAVEAARRITKRIDVIVNNAGVLLDNDIDLLDASPGLVEVTMHTNAFGPLYVTQFFMPLLGSGSRIINVSSGGGLISEGVGGWAPVYCASKTALNGITLQLAHALRSKKISVNAMCPGWVRTDMGGRSAPRTVAQGAETAVWLATDASATLTGKVFRDKKEIDW